MGTDDEFSFAPPPFKPEAALQSLQRDLRALGLSERAGQFERHGQALARARIDAGVLQVAVVRAPARSPDWQARTIQDSAQLRAFVADLKQRLARWAERDE